MIILPLSRKKGVLRAIYVCMDAKLQSLMKAFTWNSSNGYLSIYSLVSRKEEKEVERRESKLTSELEIR
jgi:hypothetical protein